MNRALFVGCAVLSILLAAFFWAKGQEEPPNPPPEPLPSSIPVVHVLGSEPLNPRGREEGERVLALFRIRWGAERSMDLATGGVCTFRYPGIFVGERHQPEFRLWARGFPGLAFDWAHRVLTEDGFDAQNRDWAARAVVELATAKYPGAEALLKQMCEGPVHRDTALGESLKAGCPVRDGNLLWKLAKRGVAIALDALSYLDDAEDLIDLKGANAPEARRAVERAEAFKYGTWAELARRAILDEKGYRDGRHFLWALRTARDHRAPWLEATLRERMSQGRIEGWIPLHGVEDDAYDFVLLTLAEIGGSLNKHEKAYLRNYGYGCEPRARLTEVLKEKGY